MRSEFSGGDVGSRLGDLGISAGCFGLVVEAVLVVWLAAVEYLIPTAMKRSR
jgi:hypothetical protein